MCIRDRYINDHDPHLKSLSYEPIEALISGSDGLDDIRKIILQAPQFLNQAGYLLLEHGYNQKNHIIDLLKESFVNIKAFKDINKIDRAILAQLR